MTDHEKMADALRNHRAKTTLALSKRAYPTHHIWADLPSYESPIDGHIVDGRVARREDLKRSGCIEYDPGMKKDAVRIAQSREAEFASKIENTVTRYIENLSSAQFKQLETEVMSGARASYTRSDR